MSQDIRNYFKVTNSNTCGLLFKNKINEPNKSLETSEIINTQPKPLPLHTINNFVTFEAFTDGSTLGNGGKNALGGIGIFFPQSTDAKNISLNYAKFVIENPEYSMNKATNNITELLAILIAIQVLTKKYITSFPNKLLTDLRIIIYSDSEYSINCITKWAPTWQKNGWKKKGSKKNDNEIKNLDIIKKIYYLFTKQRIKFVHVNSHTKEPINKSSPEWNIWYGNEMADKLAKTGAINS